MSNLTCISSATAAFRYTQSGAYTPDYTELMRFLTVEAKMRGLTQSRICFHENDQTLLQMMLVYHSKEHVVKKHVHRSKDEYLLLLLGEMTINTYLADGSAGSSIRLKKASDGGGSSFCFIPVDCIHDVVLHSDCFFLETTTGPFNSKSTEIFGE